MKDKLIELINSLEKEHDFEDDFYLTYSGQLNDGDISDWYNTHFDDNVELGYSTGQTAMAEEIIATLKKIIKEDI